MRLLTLLCSLLLGSTVLAAPPCSKCKPCDCGPECQCTAIDVYAKVAAGKTVFIAVGVAPKAEAVAVKSMKGVRPGLYRAYRDATGAHMMQSGDFVRVCHGTYCTLEWVDR